MSTTSFRATDPDLGRWFGSATASGQFVTDETSTRISAVWSCQRILSETIGALPWALFRRDTNGNAKRVDDHSLADVLTASPNRDMTPVEFKEAKTLNLCRRGNAYSFIERSGSTIVALYPIESWRVQPKRKDGGNTRLNIGEGEVFYVINDRGKTEDFPRERVWHVKGFGGNGLEGLSPLGAAREAMGFALATEEFGNRFFSQGGKPSGVATIPNWLNTDQRALARDNLQQMLAGMKNAHKFALLEGGMKLEPWGAMPLEEMQFVLLRQFSVQEICRFYRVPPHMVADLERATFSNIEHLSQEFVMFTLMPYFTRFESSASKWLLKPEERTRYFLRFNFEGLLRADSAGRAEFYSKMLQNGVMNRNEVRAKENLNRVDGLDEYTVQLNMAPIEQLASSLLTPQGTKAVEDPRSEDVIKRGLQDISDIIVLGLEKIATQKKRVVLDKDGNPLGVEPVDEIVAPRIVG